MAKKIRICKGCGAEFTRHNQGQPLYCSRKCYNQHYPTGLNHPGWKGDELNKICEQCHKSYRTYVSRQRFCSRQCLYNNITGAGHPQWKGGRFINDQGYILVYAPLHPGANKKYILEHRLMIEQSLDRKLLSTEEVHHINGDRSDNRLENLQLRSTGHGGGASFCCADCGSYNIAPVAISGG